MTPLTRAQLAADPITQFARWYATAQRSRAIRYANVMCLSTVDRQGRPDGRYVLLKGADACGFVFYTNIHSVKGRSLQRRRQAALTIYWEPLKRQVRIQGRVTLVGQAEADAYFATRPRLSQIAAWASPQSTVLPANRRTLEQRFAALRREFSGRTVPRPPFWVGFCVVPDVVELWQERPNRLHDRFRYTRRGRRWFIERLAP